MKYGLVCFGCVGLLVLPIGGDAHAVQLQISKSPDAIVLSWSSPGGNNYTVQSAPTPTGPWTDQTNLTAASSPAGWSDSPGAGVTQRFYRLIENGPFTNLLANVGAVARQVVDRAPYSLMSGAKEIGALAVFLASQLQGSGNVIATGTLTQSPANTYSYSPSPADRLVLQFTNGTSSTYYIDTMLGDFSGDAYQFLANHHDFEFRVVSAGLLDMNFVSLQTNGCTFFGTASGSVTYSNVTYAANLAVGGSYCTTVDSGYATLEDDHTIIGTISTPGLNLSVNQRRYYYSIASGDYFRSPFAEPGNPGSPLSGSFASQAEDWITNTVTLATDVYRANLHEHKSFSSLGANYVRPVHLDTEWIASGTVSKNGAAFGEYHWYVVPPQPPYNYVVLRLLLPDSIAELERYILY